MSDDAIEPADETPGDAVPDDELGDEVYDEPEDEEYTGPAQQGGGAEEPTAKTTRDSAEGEVKP